MNVFCDIFHLLDATTRLKVASSTIFFHLFSSYGRICRMRSFYLDNKTAPTHVPIIMNITIIVFMLSFIFFIFQYISRLAVKHLADSIEGRKTYSLRFPCFQDREVGIRQPHLLCQFVKRHLSLSHHHIQIHYYCHNIISLIPVPPSF